MSTITITNCQDSHQGTAEAYCDYQTTSTGRGAIIENSYFSHNFKAIIFFEK